MRRVWVLGQFSTGPALVRAARELRGIGLDDVDAHSPIPVHGLDAALALPPSRINWLCALGGFGGAGFGYLMQWWTNAVDYPINVGGRPLHSAPAFIPVTFEMDILLGALSVFLGALALCRLPRLYHPVFEVEDFRRASVDRYWVSVRCDGGTDADARRLLERLGASHISTVEEPR
jgi:hypothetical protein